MADTKKEGQGRAVVLPNKQKRIDYIRNAYYNKDTGKHVDGDDKVQTRSQIKTAINEMLDKAGRKNEQIPYQIVFAATKTPDDPRIASAAAKKAADEAKAAKVKADEAAAAKAK